MGELLMPNGDILFCKTFVVLRYTFVYVDHCSSSNIDVALTIIRHYPACSTPLNFLDSVYIFNEVWIPYS